MKLVNFFNLRKYQKKVAISQLFINSDNIKTVYTLTNFPSFYSPETAYSVIYSVKVYGGSETPAVEKTFKLDPYQSKEVTFEDCTNLPDIGVVSIDIEPESILSKSDSHLGVLKPQFYTLFHSDDYSSVGLVHPQTAFNAKGHSQNWSSNLNLDTKTVKKAVVYQINPTGNVFSNQLSLKTGDGSVLEQKQNSFSAYSAAKCTIDLKEDSRLAHLTLNETTTPNAKPIVFLYFDDGSFTVVHS